MHLDYRNVNDAFTSIVRQIHSGAIPVTVSPSRVGEVMQIDEPVLITYAEPRERVLFHPGRDINPFGLMYEALWMLAGRNDVAPIDYYMSGYSKTCSDDGITQNGAYGYRWRHAQVSDVQNWDDGDGGDQLAVLIDHLKRKPESRRAVLQMWNVEDDLLKLDTTKDCCCNLSVMFSIERGDCPACDGKGYEGTEATGPLPCIRCRGEPHEQPRYLNMTVTNRSNDLIWGCLGANYVHFTFLQEYMAAALGLECGVYNQFTNNLHAYTESNSGWHPEKWLKGYVSRTMHDKQPVDYPRLPYVPVEKGGDKPWNLVSLVEDRETFDKEVREYVEDAYDPEPYRSGQEQCDVVDVLGNTVFKEPFLETVAAPMSIAFALHKLRMYDAALAAVADIAADDWRIAAKQWIERRYKAWDSKSVQASTNES